MVSRFKKSDKFFTFAKKKLKVLGVVDIKWFSVDFPCTFSTKTLRKAKWLFSSNSFVYFKNYVLYLAVWIKVVFLSISCYQKSVIQISQIPYVKNW